MRKLALSVSLSLTFLASSLGAFAQSVVSEFVGQPFVAGNPALFTTALVNMNYTAFFGGTDLNGNSFRPQGVIPNTGIVLNERVSSYGNRFGPESRFGTSSTTTATTTLVPQNVLVFTGLINSTNPKANSTGIVYPNTNNVPVTSVSFMYSPLNLATGMVSNDINQAPVLVVTDNNGSRTRFFPVTSGLLATNAALNAYNSAFGTGSTSSSSSSSSTTATLPPGFLTATFTQAQLNLVGNVTQLGLLYDRAGVTLLNDFSVNGAQVSGVVLANASGYPF
jgi:hypothetical protein